MPAVFAADSARRQAARPTGNGPLGCKHSALPRVRLRSASAERVVQASLRRYGQMSPLVVFQWQGRYELIDGFKRLRAAFQQTPPRTRPTRPTTRLPRTGI